jgi:hypothetical protein
MTTAQAAASQKYFNALYNEGDTSSNTIRDLRPEHR